MHHSFRHAALPLLSLLIVGGAGSARAQTLPAEAPIQILQPVVDKANHTVTLPGAFWNEHMISWVEVALCGRPSDFLHETIVSVTTTKTLMMQTLREAGFHDADAWVNGVADFPKIRGDRLMIILEVTQGGKVETYSLDELLQYMGWGVSEGPYGWMFKGDPERNISPTTLPANVMKAAGEDGSDASKIVHDDPQVAIVYKGIQHSSQSFADHPLSYEDWVYPMMRYARNDKVLPTAVFDSNGGVPVKVVLKKVTEEELLTESARLWHDRTYADYILRYVPVARKIDEEKAELWRLKTDGIQKRGAEVAANAADAWWSTLLAAQIEAGYAVLDSAWAAWAVDHAAFETDDPKEADQLRQEAGLWKEHRALSEERAKQLALAAQAAYDTSKVKEAPPGAGTSSQLQALMGREMEARSLASLAENQQAEVYWKDQQSHLERQSDPRTDWIKHVDAEVEACEARALAGETGKAYGEALQHLPVADTAKQQKEYATALAKMSAAYSRLELVGLEFEISKRQDFTDDPDLPKLLARKKVVEEQLEHFEAATQPAP